MNIIGCQQSKSSQAKDPVVSFPLLVIVLVLSLYTPFTPESYISNRRLFAKETKIKKCFQWMSHANMPVEVCDLFCST